MVAGLGAALDSKADFERTTFTVADIETGEGAQIAASVEVVKTQSFTITRPGVGGAEYRRALDGEPPYAGKFQSGDGQWWELIDDVYVDANWFGADPTGQTDSYQAIQDAFDYLEDGYFVILSNGIFATSQRLTLEDHHNTFTCHGTIVPFGSYSDYLIEFIENTPGGEPELINLGNTVNIMRLRIDGKWQSRGVKFTRGYCSSRSNIFITRCYGTGMYVDEGYENTWLGVTICLGKERVKFATPSNWSSETAYIAGNLVRFKHDDYAGGTTYAAGALVDSDGITYMSRMGGNIGHTPASNPAYWWKVRDSFFECMLPHTNKSPFDPAVYTTNNGLVENRYWKYVLRTEPSLNLENTSVNGVIDHQIFFGLDIRDNAQSIMCYCDNNGNSRPVYNIQFHGSQDHAIIQGVVDSVKNTGGMEMPTSVRSIILGRTADCVFDSGAFRTAKVDDSASIEYGLNVPGKVSWGLVQIGRLDGEGDRSTGVIVGAAQSGVVSRSHFFQPSFAYPGDDSAPYIDPFNIVRHDHQVPIRAPNVGGLGTCIRLDAAQSIASATPTMLVFGHQDIDIHDFWKVAAPTRFTIPHGVTMIRIAGNVLFDAIAGTSYRVVRLYKNGSPVLLKGFDVRVLNVGNGTATGVNFISGRLSVVEGDYFEIEVTQNSGSSLNVLAGGSTYVEVDMLA